MGGANEEFCDKIIWLSDGYHEYLEKSCDGSIRIKYLEYMFSIPIESYIPPHSPQKLPNHLLTPLLHWHRLPTPSSRLYVHNTKQRMESMAAKEPAETSSPQ
jgi:hypothetical protein